MNRHLKIAFMVAPFLLIGGYIIADYLQTEKERKYLESRGPQFDARQLVLDDECELVKGHCVLRSGALNLNLSISGDRYLLTSNTGLDDVVMSLAQEDRQTRALRFSPHEGRRQWSTAIRRLTNLEMDELLNIRMVVRSNDIQYYAEIPVNAAGPWNE